MKLQSLPTVDVVMLGSFGAWTRGTIQSRALPLAREASKRQGIRFAIITTPWDDPSQAGTCQKVDDVLILNTRTHELRQAARVVWEQMRIARHLEPALIHVLKPKAAPAIAAEVLRHTRKQPAVLVDCDDWEGDGGWNQQAAYPLPVRRLFNVQENRLIRLADGVTTASTLLEERALRIRRGAGPSRVEYLPNGLDAGWRDQLATNVRKESPNSRSGLILYSRFAEFSTDWLVALITRIDQLAQNPLTLDVIGPTEDFSIPFGHCQRLEINVHGYVGRSALPSLLGRSAVALYPYADNLINRSKQSVKLLELMAAGCAVVCSDVGEIQRIGAGSVATVKSRDVDAFASAAIALINDPDRAAKLGESARERAAAFDISVLGSQLAGFYGQFGVK